MRRLAPLAAALAVVAAVVGGGHARAETVYAVSIGNNLGRPHEGVLRYAEDDAAAVDAVLRRLGGANAEHVRLLLGVTADEVRRALDAVADKLREAGGADTKLVVYYSGHAGARGLHLGDTTLPFDELRRAVKAVPARMRVLIVDACRSGGVTRVKGVKRAGTFVIDASQSQMAEGLAVISSSAAGEDSHESDALRSSFFTHHLVNGLRGAADDDLDRQITLDEAYRYTFRETLRSSGSTAQLQHPTYRYDLKGRGAVVLTRIAESPRGASRLSLAAPGLYLLMDDRDGRLVAEVTIGKRGADLVLPPGSYFVQKRERRAYREYNVSLAPGETRPLDDASERVIAYAQLVRKGGGERAFVHGLYLLGGARGEILDGYGITPQVTLGWELDFEDLSLGVRGRFTTASGSPPAGIETASHSEVGGGVVVHRFFDLPWFSFAIGLWVEATWLTQRFVTPGRAPERSAWGAAFGGLVTLERQLVGGLALRLEAGPITHVFERAVTEGGAQVGTETATPLTWWAAGGMDFRF